jgi:flagellin-like protein
MQAMPAGGHNMNKIWSKDGVSPVIATILMVAITVVLAAVLYVMVNFGTEPEIPGTGNIENIDIMGNQSVEIRFGPFSGATRPTELKVILEDELNHRTTLSWPRIPDSESFSMASTDPAVTATYRDFVPVANEINAGDSIVISGLRSGGAYEILIITMEGSKLSLLGTTNFVTPS